VTYFSKQLIAFGSNNSTSAKAKSFMLKPYNPFFKRIFSIHSFVSNLMVKVFNLVFASLFLICAGLQWNDPDPYFWMPLYLSAALSCAYAFKDISAKRLNIFNIAVYSVYAAYLLFVENGVISWATEHNFDSLTQSMLASAPWIENTREFGGLSIMLVVCAVNLYTERRRISKENLLAEDEHPVNA
jgi:hypothetical protein